MLWCFSFFFYPCRGSSLSTMRTGERHWSVRTAQYFVFWTSKVTMSLYWRECLKISHLDRLVQQIAQFHMVPFLGTSHTFVILLLLSLCLSVTVSAGILGTRWHRCGVCRLVPWAFQTWPQVLPQQEVITFQTDQREELKLAYQKCPWSDS